MTSTIHRLLRVGAGLLLATTALTACANKSGDSRSGTTLKLAWQSGTGDTWIQPTITQFEKAHPGITVKLEASADANLAQTIPTQLLAGNGPDLFLTTGVGSALSAQKLGRQGYLAPLNSLPWATSSYDYVRQYGSANGTTYQVVPGLTTTSAIYNMGTMKKLGLTVPTTFSQVLSFCHAASAKGVTAFGLGLQEGWTTLLVPGALMASGLINDVTTWNPAMTGGSFSYPDSAWSAALDLQKKMSDAGCFNTSPLGTSVDNSVLPGLATGKFAAIVSVSAHIPVVQGLTKTPLDLQAYPLPSTEQSSANKFLVGNANGLSVNAKSKHLDLALDFIKMWSEPAAIATLSHAAGLIPTEAGTPYTAADGLTTANQYVQSSRSLSFLWSPNADVTSALIDNIQSWILGKASIPDALGKVEQKYQATVKK